MSKKQQNTNGNGVEGTDYIILSGGEKVEFIGIDPTFLQRVQAAGTLPSVPYREVPTAFGENQKEELSEEDLQNDEERAQWAEYKEKRDAVLTKRHTNFIKAILAKGTKVNESQLQAWKKEQVEFWELEVPDNPIDLKTQYLQDILRNNSEETMEIVVGVLAKTGIPEEAMEEIRTMFRSALRQGSTRQAEST